MTKSYYSLTARQSVITKPLERVAFLCTKKVQKMLKKILSLRSSQRIASQPLFMSLSVDKVMQKQKRNPLLTANKLSGGFHCMQPFVVVIMSQKPSLPQELQGTILNRAKSVIPQSNIWNFYNETF